MWGELLAAQGYGALMLDSFSSRGVRELCTQKFSERSLKEADRVGDAYAALAWLRQQPGVDAARIVLLGWSHGGGVTLDAITRPPAGLPQGFAAAAFYPGCKGRVTQRLGFIAQHRSYVIKHNLGQDLVQRYLHSWSCCWPRTQPR
jgi:dienelactone hydrolase